MPTPIFGVRLPVKDRETLELVARVYGAKNASEFAREVLSVMCSGDVERIRNFNRRLIMAGGEQLILKLNAPLDAAPPVPQVVIKRRRKPKSKRRVHDPAP
jgi:hypothetical protein